MPKGLAASLAARGAEILARRDMGDHGYLIAISEPPETTSSFLRNQFV